MTPVMIKYLGFFMIMVCIKNILELVGCEKKIFKILSSAGIILASVLFLLTYALSYPYLG